MKAGPEVMREMRLKWLDPKQSGQGDVVSAALMDWPVGGQVATVCASSGGDGSLYTTSTFGIIGGIGHEAVRSASKAFVKAAEKCLPLATATTDFRYSMPGQIKFYFVTPSCVFGLIFLSADIEKEGSPARYLYAHGQKVVTELRLTVNSSPKSN